MLQFFHTQDEPSQGRNVKRPHFTIPPILWWLMCVSVCACVYVLYIHEDGCFMAQVVFGGGWHGTYPAWQAIDLSMLVRRFSLGHLRRLPYRNWLLGCSQEYWGIISYCSNLPTFVATPKITSGISRLPMTALITRSLFSIRVQIESGRGPTWNPRPVEGLIFTALTSLPSLAASWELPDCDATPPSSPMTPIVSHEP